MTRALDRNYQQRGVSQMLSVNSQMSQIKGLVVNKIYNIFVEGVQFSETKKSNSLLVFIDQLKFLRREGFEMIMICVETYFNLYEMIKRDESTNIHSDYKRHLKLISQLGQSKSNQYVQNK